MTSEPCPGGPRFIRRVLAATHDGGLIDAHLLERFVRFHDEAAFEVLVWRHGPMVRGVCHRILRHEQDAEDAFQATFLILARKAATVGNGRAIAGWLHRVAHRVAVRAKAAVRRRVERETPLGDVPAAERVPDVVWSDLRPILDEEVNRLPEKYRTPFILCYLAGRTNAEAARELGCPPGSVVSRLAWARERLRTRLARRGVTLSAVAAAAALPAGLVTSAVAAAVRIAAGETVAGVASAPVVALTQGVLRAMYWTRIKIVTGCLLAAGVLGAGGVLWRPGPEPGVRAEGPAEPPPKADKQDRPPAKVEEKTYKFEIREKPWKDVLEWYADTSGLPFIGSSWPAGTFTFVAPRGRKYTLGEITDLINEALQAQKHILVRREASFTVLPAAEKIDPTLLPQVRPEDLENRGRTELVRLELSLTFANVEEIAPDVRKLLGPFGAVVVLEKANRLLLQDTVGNLRRIVERVKDLEDRKGRRK